MKRRIGIIVLWMFVGALAFAGSLDVMSVADAMGRVEHVSDKDAACLAESDTHYHYDANINAPSSNVAFPEYHTVSFYHNSVGRNDYRSLHKSFSCVFLKNGKLLDSHLVTCDTGFCRLSPFGSTDPDKSFIRLGKLLI